MLGEVFRHGFRENPGDPLLVSGHAFVVSLPQGHDVVIRGELPTACQLTNVLLAFSLERDRHFLRDDVATEHACEGIPHEVLESPVEALYATHRGLPPHTCASAPILSGGGSLDTAPAETRENRLLSFAGCQREATRASGGMADAHGSGPCVRKDVRVQLPPRPLCSEAPSARAEGASFAWGGSSSFPGAEPPDPHGAADGGTSI